MKWFHRRWRRRAALLAAGALGEREAVATRAHIETCPECLAEWTAAARVWRLADDDPARGLEMPLSAAALARRVWLRVDAAGDRAGLRQPWTVGRVLPAGLAAALLVAVVGWLGWRQVSSQRNAEEDSSRVEVSGEVFARMERRVARDGTARYLAQARDVLASVASRPQYCDRRARRIDVADEAQRSRALLARRALLVDADAPAVASARTVLDDVERTLRDVAALDPCAEPGALAALRAEMEQRRLLLKIDIVSRELLG